MIGSHFFYLALGPLALLLSRLPFIGATSITQSGIAIRVDLDKDLIMSVEREGGSVLFSTESFEGYLWEFDLVDRSAGVKLTTPGDCDSVSVENISPEMLDLYFHQCGVHNVDVIVHCTVGLGGGVRPTASMTLELRNAPADVSVYQVKVNLPINANATMAKDDYILVPDSYGVLSKDPMNFSWGGTYPSAGCSMQFFGYGNEDGSCYLGVHDKTSQWKQLSWNKGVFSIKLTPEDSTMPLTMGSWKLGFPIVFADLLEAVSVTTPLWYSASQAYREFIFGDDGDAAPWVSKGKIGDRLTNALKETDVWLNTGWQCVDIFESQQGDPSTALERVSSVVSKWRQKGLESPIGLHFYEWQQGPEDGEENRYKFDTHYPDYFPSRVSDDGEDLKSASEKLLRDHDVYTYPYINGRIFDLNSTSFKEDDGEQYCVKVPTEDVRLFEQSSEYELVTTTESYGSGPTFCVANPYEEYWQQKISDTVEELVTSEGTAGVYIDQIASAPMQLCFDPKMGHTLGNGGWWVSGYREMMGEIRSRTTAPIVTESNAESYMDMMEGFLILTVFFKSFVEEASTPWSVPAYASVYGGYYNAFGAEFYASEFKDLQYLKAKLAKQLVYGAQLGWFSLGGIEDDTCGEMGLVELFMDDEYDEVNDWIVSMANARGNWRKYFLEGRAVQDVSLDPPANVMMQTEESKSPATSSMYYHDVVMGVWKIEEETEASVAVFLVNVMTEDAVKNVGMDLKGWGFALGDTVEVTFGDKTMEVIVEGGLQSINNLTLKVGEATVLEIRPI
mmetsp:Transcript_14729/g.30289  ORF Transcript_14729/g.30289 Transcript_14729/m.30289 type:complete len:787 (+) Transcript_14729:3-2363(+)